VNIKQELKNMSEENKLVGVTMPLTTYTAVVTRLKPLQTVQDYIRTLIEKDLREVKA
jgi:cAMP phosphodiesterase